ncbi:MAG: hypothetical protein WD638_13300 [Nitriliruptoraceae bacterium]
MKKTFLVMAMVIALAMSAMAPAMANGKWDNQVTGGGEFAYGSDGTFDLAVSSRTAADGTTKGMFQYTQDDRAFHGVVDCLHVDAEGDVTMSGDVKNQEGFWVEYGAVTINAEGTKVRVHDVSPDEKTCGHSETYGATLIDGSFNIK